MEVINMAIVNEQDNWSIRTDESGVRECKTEARKKDGRLIGMTDWMPLPNASVEFDDNEFCTWILDLASRLPSRRVAIQKLFSGVNVALQQAARSNSEERELKELARLQAKYPDHS
jgi:hypothetical protein